MVVGNPDVFIFMEITNHYNLFTTYGINAMLYSQGIFFFSIIQSDSLVVNVQ